ncbi:MAG: DUF559 domain-containing protein [Ardenticatenales bacterium]|nr:DUF559 domain-containing protein [Ardenticatenales bacterium]
MSRTKLIPYNAKLLPLAKKLRQQSTLAEILLWQQLQGKKLLGYDFHRQKPLDHYIVDFFCPALLLAIEIDGDSHEGQADADERRQARLESWGVRFLRFQDREVRQEMEKVLRIIEAWIEVEDES